MKQEITVSDMRSYSRSKGLDPDKWNYISTPNGFNVRKGAFMVGTLMFEAHAELLVAALNACPAEHSPEITPEMIEAGLVCARERLSDLPIPFSDAWLRLVVEDVLTSAVCAKVKGG